MEVNEKEIRKRYWNQLKTPPPTALKTIKAGRLKGMSDISPQWRYEAMTEVFGPCGIGWKYEITKLWTEPGSDGQILAFALVEVSYTNVDGKWSQPIPGIGGNTLIAKESKGLHTSDECFKMAVTDALSVALKMIGVGSDVYMGNMDGSKYRPQPQQQAPPPKPKFTKKDNDQVQLIKDTIDKCATPADIDACWEENKNAWVDMPKHVKEAGWAYSKDVRAILEKGMGGADGN